MADTNLTGATTDVPVDNAAVVEKRKKIIKYAIIAVVLLAVGFVVYKYVLKK